MSLDESPAHAMRRQENVLDAKAEAWMAENRAPTTWPPPLELARLAESDPEPPRYLIDGWMPAGYATLVAGHGGTGKSGAVALPAAICLASGRPFYGLPVTRSRVLYLSFEDREPVLHWRLTRICRHLGVDLASLAGDLVLLDLVGEPAILYERDRVPPGFHCLRTAIDEHRPDVIVVDGISDTYGGGENDRAQVKAFVSSLVRLIDGERGGVLLVGHVEKASALGGGEGYSGSTGWHNACRGRWYLFPESERDEDGAARASGDLILENRKQNLGRAGARIRLRWDDAAGCFAGHAEGAPSHFERREQEEAEREGIVAALREVIAAGEYCPAASTGPRTAYSVLSVADSFPESLRPKAARRRFRRLLQELRHSQRIRESSIRRENRHHTATLVPNATDGAACEAAPNAPHESDAPLRVATHGAPAPNAPHAQGGYRGVARAQPCPRCDGEGCPHCRA
jgi:RecA-family ATPase